MFVEHIWKSIWWVGCRVRIASAYLLATVSYEPAPLFSVDNEQLSIIQNLCISYDRRASHLPGHHNNQNGSCPPPLSPYITNNARRGYLLNECEIIYEETAMHDFSSVQLRAVLWSYSSQGSSQCDSKIRSSILNWFFHLTRQNRIGYDSSNEPLVLPCCCFIVCSVFAAEITFSWYQSQTHSFIYLLIFLYYFYRTRQVSSGREKWTLNAAAAKSKPNALHVATPLLKPIAGPTWKAESLRYMPVIWRQGPTVR